MECHMASSPTSRCPDVNRGGICPPLPPITREKLNCGAKKSCRALRSAPDAVNRWMNRGFLRGISRQFLRVLTRTAKYSGNNLVVELRRMLECRRLWFIVIDPELALSFIQ